MDIYVQYMDSKIKIKFYHGNKIIVYQADSGKLKSKRKIRNISLEEMKQ